MNESAIGATKARLWLVCLKKRIAYWVARIFVDLFDVHVGKIDVQTGEVALNA